MTTQNEAEAGTQSRWQFDPYHTQVEFAAKHLGMMTVRGNFTELTATGYINTLLLCRPTRYGLPAAAPSAIWARAGSPRSSRIRRRRAW